MEGQNNGGMGNSGLALSLVLIGMFIPFIGFFLVIYGIVLGFSARKTNPDDGMALAAIIIGFIVVAILPVLIVGALMFSFVDFGALLPNKVDLSGDLRASSIESFATYTDSGSTEVLVVFRYLGVKSMYIDPQSLVLEDLTGNDCTINHLNNVETEKEEISEDVFFMNGQTGYVSFKCDIPSDVFEGSISIPYFSEEGNKKLSSGNLRLNVQ